MQRKAKKYPIELLKVSEFEVRLVRDKPTKKAAISSPEDAKHVLMPLCTFDREQSFVVYLNARRQVVGVELISVVHPSEVFKGAILANAAAIIVAHTHPSGYADPSDEDKAITKRLTQAGELLGIAVLDHVILTVRGQHSMRAWNQL